MPKCPVSNYRWLFTNATFFDLAVYMYWDFWKLPCPSCPFLKVCLCCCCVLHMQSCCFANLNLLLLWHNFLLTSPSPLLTALFTNMRILKFKSQLMITFFAAVNHLNGPLRKLNFTWTGSKGHLWLVDFDPFCVFLCFKVRC